MSEQRLSVRRTGAWSAKPSETHLNFYQVDIDDFDKFDDFYQGEFCSKEAFAEHIVDECYDIERTMGNLSYYFDYGRFARDLFMCDYIFENGYVFCRC